MLVRALDFSDPHDAAAWDALVARAPERSPFAHRAFGAALAEARGIAFSGVGAFGPVGPQQHERLVAALPVYAALRGPLRCAVVPPLAFYTPLLADPPVREGEVLARTSPLDRLLAAVQTRYAAAAVHLDPSTTDVRAFSWAGFAVRPLYTYRFDAGAPYAPEKETRRMLRSGAALSVDEVDPREPSVQPLVRAHYAKPGRRPPFSEAAGQRLFARLADAGLLRVYRCGAEAALAVLEDDRAAYAWLVGSPRGAAATVLFDHAIRRALDAGRTFDFFGANTPSLAHFKKAFGGALVPFFRAAWHRPGLPRWIAAVRPLV